MNQFVLIAFIGWKIFLFVLVFVTGRIGVATGQFIPDSLLRMHLPSWLWIWGNFDGNYYLSIARSGYLMGQQAFFPLYPFFIKLLYEVTGMPLVISGQLISICAIMLSLFVIDAIARQDKDDHLFPLLYLVLFLYPTAYYYTAVYNDALFFLFANLCLLFARRRSWLFASISASLATLTRLEGLALAGLIFVEYVVQSGDRLTLPLQWHWKTLKNMLKIIPTSIRAKTGVLWVASVPLMFLGYLFYIHQLFGAWHLVFSSMKVWHQDQVTFPLRVLGRYINIMLFHYSSTIEYFVAVNELVFFLGYIFLLIYSWKKIRLSYWIFFLLSVLIPSLTGTFQGMPRYGLHIYPMFLTLTLLLRNAHPLVKVLYFSWSVGTFVAMLVLFALGYFVA